jgi:D-arabinose 1-dehydrogenase-like Zn-dependent alcohol dehydrogenase
MRICVYGAGAIGGHLAVRLARGGAEVSVLARGAHLAAIQQSGLTVHTTEGQLNARVEAELMRDVWGLGPVISTVFWPVTKMLEYKVTGSLGQPKSEPVFFLPRIVLMPFRGSREILPEDTNSNEIKGPPFRSE